MRQREQGPFTRMRPFDAARTCLLLVDVQKLQGLVATATYQPAQLANGATDEGAPGDREAPAQFLVTFAHAAIDAGDAPPGIYAKLRKAGLSRRISAIMDMAIMPVPSKAPARCNCRPRRIADHSARDQPNWTADQGPRQRAHSAVTKPLLRICGGRQQSYSRDRTHNQKRLRHADAPAHVPAMPMAYLSRPGNSMP